MMEEFDPLDEAILKFSSENWIAASPIVLSARLKAAWSFQLTRTSRAIVLLDTYRCFFSRAEKLSMRKRAFTM
jgi:hypothetical protein